MTSEQIRTIGNFISYYKSDLDYIKSFQNFKNNKISETEYIAKEYATFYTFLIEFKVIRNISKGKVDKLLHETLDFINDENSNDVDLFAKKLAKTEFTHSKIMTSLASKILFLNNPWEILPIDSLARNTVKQRDNKYINYQEHLKKFKMQNFSIVEKCLTFTKPITDIIHKEFKQDIANLDIIAQNRMFDKLLWTLGK